MYDLQCLLVFNVVERCQERSLCPHILGNVGEILWNPDPHQVNSVPTHRLNISRRTNSTDTIDQTRGFTRGELTGSAGSRSHVLKPSVLWDILRTAAEGASSPQTSPPISFIPFVRRRIECPEERSTRSRSSEVHQDKPINTRCYCCCFHHFNRFISSAGDRRFMRRPFSRPAWTMVNAEDHR